MNQWIMTAVLLAVCLFPATPVIGAGEADDTDSIYYFEFQPNPPDQRIDYFAPGDFHRGLGRALDLKHSVESKHLKPARQCVRERNAGCARHELDFVLRWIPNHPEGLSLLSTFAMQRGKPEAALPYLDFAIKQFPEYASTYIIYGIHRYRMGQYAAAEERFDQALQRKPDSASAHYNLGLALLQQDRLSEAREHAKRAYDLGYPLPGLRRMLQERGAWAETTSSAQ